MEALYAGLVCWLVTMIVVESEMFRPVREMRLIEERPKLAYLVNCYLCAGTWIGIALGLLVPGPLGLFLLDGLLYKAAGHALLILQRVGERAAR